MLISIHGLWKYEFLIVLVGFTVFDCRLGILVFLFYKDGILVFLFYQLGILDLYPMNGAFLYYADIPHIIDGAFIIEYTNERILDF